MISEAGLDIFSAGDAVIYPRSMHQLKNFRSDANVRLAIVPAFLSTSLSRNFVTSSLQHLAELVDKIDPREERRRKSVGRTVENIFADFLERYAKPQNRSWKETQRIFKKDIIPAFGGKLIQDDNL